MASASWLALQTVVSHSEATDIVNENELESFLLPGHGNPTLIPEEQQADTSSGGADSLGRIGDRTMEFTRLSGCLYQDCVRGDLTTVSHTMSLSVQTPEPRSEQVLRPTSTLKLSVVPAPTSPDLGVLGSNTRSIPRAPRLGSPTRTPSDLCDRSGVHRFSLQREFHSLPWHLPLLESSSRQSQDLFSDATAAKELPFKRSTIPGTMKSDPVPNIISSRLVVDPMASTKNAMIPRRPSDYLRKSNP